MANLGTKSIVVLDLVALATLRLLGITRQVLKSGGFRFVVSAATYTELQELRARSRFATAHGTMYYQDGQHYMTRTTEEQSEKEKAAFEEWMQCIENNTTVLTVPEVAALDPERRKVFEKMFGREGVEAALLALTPGNILWTDDLVFAEVAKSELGVERVWTQALVEHLANRGLIDRALADEAYAKLVGFDYQSTQFTGAVMVAALRASKGSVDAFPMRQTLASSAAVGMLKTVLTSLEETENALTGYAEEQSRRDHLEATVRASQDALDLTNAQYRAGLTDFLTVLDSERTLFENQDLLAQSQTTLVTDLVTLYKALGGGWAPEAHNLTAKSQSEGGTKQ
jgi:hypothetical protein